MATQTTTGANVVSKSENMNAAEQQGKTRRVLETRDRWSVIYNHTVTLVVLLANSEKLPANAADGYAWRKVADEPNSRFYAKSLIAGFVSNKAGKVFAKNEFLANKANREKIASAILIATKLVKPTGKQTQQDAVNGTLAKTEPKQARSFAESVLVELSKPEPQKATTKGGKKSEKTTTPKGGSKGKSSKPATKGGKKSNATK